MFLFDGVVHNCYVCPERRGPFGRIGVDVRVVLVQIKKEMCESVDWIHLARDVSCCSTVVNTVTSSRFP